MFDEDAAAFDDDAAAFHEDAAAFDDDAVEPRLRTLLRAFADDAVSCWLVPEPERRYAVYHEWFGMVLAHADRAGEVVTADDTAAVQVWLSGVDSPPRMVEERDEQRLAELLGTSAPRFRTFGELMSARHPAEPHQYLALIGVEPALQNAGIGGRALAAVLRRWDEQGVPAYLEASSTRSRQLYLRLGFRDLGPAVQLPDGPVLHPMWREPEAL
ncbi:GNAT family N-acetyltransferase [Saccharopolyspora taberi]|uniref:GNAT family N-acetyltransferase n=1 Tax=Saccharopolyspora taberi TaxID=60895 RepID=A0ABN3VDG5_9PSEU